ncbi:MAG: glycosyltransferase 87 family protein [Propionibacteriaceae bacterium]
MSAAASAASEQSSRSRLPWDDRRGGVSVVVGWVLTRALMFVLLALPESFVVGDVYYYWRKIATLWSVGLPSTLNEYPTPVVWLLTLPYVASAGARVGYLVAFIVLMVGLDALFTLVLFRAVGRRRGVAVDFWIAFVFLVGPLGYLRFDLIPAILAGAALLLARTRPGVTGALTGLGAALKLWPALLYGAFLAPRGRRTPLSWGFWGVGVGLAALSLAFGGFRRLVSPLTWQSDRGLQVESLWSTPLMMARALNRTRWTVDISRYQAYEIFGPGVQAFLVASNVATVAGLILIALLFLQAFRSIDPSPRAVGLVVVAVIVIMIITNKTLSPQYLLWLGGPVAALLVLDRRRIADRLGVRDRDSAAIDGLARQLLVLALLTHLVYPLLYDGLLYLNKNDVALVVSTAVTALRNLALLIFAVAACRAAWVALGRRRPRPEPEAPSL